MTTLDQFVKHLIAQATGGNNGNGNGNGGSNGNGGGEQARRAFGQAIANQLQTQAGGEAGPFSPGAIAALNALHAPQQPIAPPLPTPGPDPRFAALAGIPLPPVPADMGQGAQTFNLGGAGTVQFDPSQTQQTVQPPPLGVATDPGSPLDPLTNLVNAVTPDAINRGNVADLVPDRLGGLIPNQLNRDNALGVASALPFVGDALGIGELAAKVPGLTAELARSPRNAIDDLLRHGGPGDRTTGTGITSLLSRGLEANPVQSVGDLLIGKPATKLLQHPEQIPRTYEENIDIGHPLSTGMNILGGIASVPLYAQGQHEVLDRVGDIQHSMVTGHDTNETRAALAIMTLGLSEVMRLRPGQHKNALDEDAGRLDVIKAAIDQGVPPVAFLDLVVGGDDAVQAARESSGGNDTASAVHQIARNKLPWGADVAYDILTGMTTDPWTLTMAGPGLIGSFTKGAAGVEEASVARQALEAMGPEERAAALEGQSVEHALLDPEARARIAGHGDQAGFVPDPQAVATATRYRAAATIVKAIVQIAEAPEKLIFKPVGAALKGLTYPFRGAFAPADRAVKQARTQGITEGVGQVTNVQARQAEIEAARQQAMAAEGPVGPAYEAPAPDAAAVVPPTNGATEPAPPPAAPEVVAPTNGAAPLEDLQHAAVADLADRTLPTPDQLNGMSEDPQAAAAAAVEAAKPQIQLGPDDVNSLLDLRDTRAKIEDDLAKVPESTNLINREVATHNLITRLATTQNSIYRLITTAEGARRDLYPNPLNIEDPARGRLAIEDRVDGGVTQAAAPAEPIPVAEAAPTTTDLTAAAAPIPDQPFHPNTKYWRKADGSYSAYEPMANGEDVAQWNYKDGVWSFQRYRNIVDAGPRLYQNAGDPKPVKRMPKAIPTTRTEPPPVSAETLRMQRPGTEAAAPTEVTAAAAPTYTVGPSRGAGPSGVTFEPWAVFEDRGFGPREVEWAASKQGAEKLRAGWEAHVEGPVPAAAEVTAPPVEDVNALQAERTAAEARYAKESRDVQRMETRNPNPRKTLNDARGRAAAVRAEIDDLTDRIRAAHGPEGPRLEDLIQGPRPEDLIQGPRQDELIQGPRLQELIPEDLLRPGAPRPETLAPQPEPLGPPQPQEGPPLPEGPAVGPTEDLGDLGPQPDKNRLAEQVAEHGKRYPQAAKNFWDAYSPLAKARREQQAATDLRLRGRPDLKTARAVQAAEHMVQDIKPLFREHVGREGEVLFDKGKGDVAKRTTPQLLDRMLHDSDSVKRADAYSTLNWLSTHTRTELAPYMDRIRALRDQNEAERFPNADAERTGPRHEALGTSADRSYNPWPTATDPIAEAHRVGDLSDENYHALIEPVEVRYENAKGKSVTVEHRVIDAYTRNLQTMGPEEALQATFKQIDDAERTLPKGQQRPSAARRYFRPLKAFDKLQTFVKNKQQFSLLTFPRGFSFDWAGDAGLMLANGEGHAVWRAGLPGGKLFRRALKDVQGQTLDGMVNADPGQVAGNLGLDRSSARSGHQGITSAISPEATAAAAQEFLPAAQWMLERTGSRGLAKATGAVTGMQSGANLRAAGDLVRRGAFWTTVMVRQLPEQRRAYLRELARTGAANGLDPAAVRRITTTLGEQFAPADVRRLAAAEGLPEGVSTRLANDWQHRVTTMDKAARARVSEILPDFSKTTKADEVMRRFFMYHFWLTRSSPIYLRTVLKNPALLREFNNYATEMQQECEGRGGQMCGWARILSEHGFGLFGNPGAVASTMFLDLDPNRSLGPDATAYDKIKNKIPLMTSPLLDAATGYLGLSSRSPDLLAMAGDSNAAVAGVNALKARGLIPGVGPGPIANPYLKITNGISRRLSGVFGGDEGILRQQPDIDPLANDTSNIQWRATELVAQKYKLTPTLDTASWPKQAASDLVAAKTSILSGNYDDPIARQALKDWTAGNLSGQALKYALMGGVPVRSEFKIDERTAAQKPVNIVGPDSARLAAQAAASGAQSQLNAGDIGSQAELDLWKVDQQRSALLVDANGVLTKAGQADALYNDIVYGDVPNDVVIGGETVPGADIATLPAYDSDITPDTAPISRDAVAKRALTDRGLFADWQTLKTTEDTLAADPANAQWKALQSYRKGVREQGPATFIAAAVKGNPSYQYWYEHLSDQTRADPKRLEAAAMGIDAFLALMGEKSSAWTPNMPTRDASQIPYNPAIEGTGAEPGTLAGAGAGAGGFTHKSRGQMVLEDQAKYEAEVAMVKPVLFQLTGDPNFDLANTNPMLQTALLNELDAMGVTVPSLPKSVQRYQTWKATQPKGADTSLLAYTQFGEAFDASMAGTGKDFDMVMDILAAKGVPGFSALGALGLDGATAAPGGSPLSAVGSRSGYAPSVLDVMNSRGGNYADSTSDILNRRRGYTQTTSDILGNGRFAQTVNDLLRGR
jgi:hypothetical protein